MKRLLLVGVILLITPHLTLADGIIERYKQFMAMEDTQYINNISELPTNIDTTPNKNATVIDLKDKQGYFLGNLAAWVDIVGFKNTVRENDINYTASAPEKSAIIESDTSYSFTKKCGECYLDKMLKNVSVKSSDGNITAFLNVTMRWYQVHWVWCGDGCWYPIYELHNNYLNVSDSEKSPLTYPRLDRNTSVYIDIFNNSFEPKTTISFDSRGASLVNVSYRGNRLTHHTKTMKVDYYEGIPYGNVTRVDSWNKTGDEVSHIGTTFVINGTASLEDIIIQVSTPFETVRLTNYTVHTESSETFTPLFVPFVSVLIIIFTAITKIMRSL